jgi:DNA-binding protein HU-beta
MTKAELIKAVLSSKEIPTISKKATGEIVDAVFENLAKAIRKDRRFVVPGFGTFSVRKRKARVGRNPRTGDEIKIQAAKTVTFKPAPDFKQSL